ncbi:hypothetical protein MKZ38_001154 [Zalerion maritima]|uniref:DUF7053 domain-containing protein n=1 Tax=Zalerion maritima TaxID=339359 RepID=A0AAD5RRS4_9PEZI|nr:hypothetical protein MKZ38_001154 [Zalerion maritima]
MSKRTVFTTITPLPPGATRDVVLDFLHNHLEMIDLNPLVKERHPIKPPPHASPEEFHCIWYSLTDKISYLPGGLAAGDVSYKCAFHDLPNGLQTHCYAPMGLDIRDKWTLGGSLPGEPVQPVELGVGAPVTGLYLREDVDMKCNMLMTGFVKKNLKKSHGVLVDRLKVKAQIASAANLNHSMSIRHSVNSAASQNGGAPGQHLGSPDPNRFPSRPSSTASAHSANGPPVTSPDPTRSEFGQGPGAPNPPYSPPAQYSQHQSLPQGSVTWQSLKSSPSVSSHYNPAMQGRTPSFIGQPPHTNQQQYNQYPPQMNQYGGQHMQHGRQQQYGQQQYPYHPQQQQQHSFYQPPQNAAIEMGGYHPPPTECQGGAPQVPGKDPTFPAQPPKTPDDTKHNQNQSSSLNGPFIAELE